MVGNDWINSFSMPELTHLITEALNYNYDLKAAAARVKSSQALVRINGADRFPQFSFGFDARRSQRNSTGGFRISSPISNSFGIDFSLSWELDVWGKLQNRANAAELDFKASEAEAASIYRRCQS